MTVNCLNYFDKMAATPPPFGSIIEKRAFRFAALVSSAVLFAFLWSFRSSSRQVGSDRNSPDDIHPADTREQKLIWSVEGLIPGMLLSSPDDRYLAGVLYQPEIHGLDDFARKRVFVIDLKSGDAVCDARLMRPLALAFLSDGPCLAILSQDVIGRRTVITVLNIES